MRDYASRRTQLSRLRPSPPFPERPLGCRLEGPVEVALRAVAVAVAVAAGQGHLAERLLRP